MSQIADAFGVSSEDLRQLAGLLGERDYNAYLELLRPKKIGPDFGYSGYVIAVVYEYLREKSIELPLNLSHPDAKLLSSQGGFVSISGSTESAQTFQALSGLPARYSELAQYWQNWTGDNDLEAGNLMWEGINWLREVFRVGKDFEWCLLAVG